MKAIFLTLLVIVCFKSADSVFAQENKQYSTLNQYCANQPTALKPCFVGLNGPINIRLISTEFKEIVKLKESEFEGSTPKYPVNQFFEGLNINDLNFYQLLKLQNPYYSTSEYNFYQKIVTLNDSTKIITPKLFGGQINTSTYLLMIERFFPPSTEEMNRGYNGEYDYEFFVFDDINRETTKLPCPESNVNKVTFKDDEIIIEQEDPTTFLTTYYYYVFNTKSRITTVYQE